MITLEENYKRLKEEKAKARGKKLVENAPNFFDMKNFPLLAFEAYEDMEQRVFETAKQNIENSGRMSYEEIVDSPEYDKAWDMVKICVLDTDEVNELEKDISDFNYDMERDDRYDPYEDTEVKVVIEPGYHSGAQIYVEDEEYLLPWQIEEINNFLETIKEKYHLSKLGVAYRFSNGETGYDVINEARKSNPALKYNQAKDIKEAKYIPSEDELYVATEDDIEDQEKEEEEPEAESDEDEKKLDDFYRTHIQGKSDPDGVGRKFDTWLMNKDDFSEQTHETIDGYMMSKIKEFTQENPEYTEKQVTEAYALYCDMLIYYDWYKEVHGVRPRWIFQ